GRSCDHSNAPVVGTVPALRLPTHPGVSGAAGLSHERGAIQGSPASRAGIGSTAPPFGTVGREPRGRPSNYSLSPKTPSYYHAPMAVFGLQGRVAVCLHGAFRAVSHSLFMPDGSRPEV